MFQIPPIPSWDALHPLIIHFPIALLLIAPLFVIVGAVMSPVKGRAYLIAAMVLLLLGTAATFIAVATGKAAGQLAERTPGVEQVLEAHESLAESTRVVFTVLSAIFVALLAVPRLLKKSQTRLATSILPMAFLILYGAGALLLVKTAHQGGRLVHELGVRALVTSPAANTTVSVPAENEHDQD